MSLFYDLAVDRQVYTHLSTFEGMKQAISPFTEETCIKNKKPTREGSWMLLSRQAPAMEQEMQLDARPPSS